MSEINAQKNATEPEAKNFYEWLENNKAHFDDFMSTICDCPFPPAIKDNVTAKFKIISRALTDTIRCCEGPVIGAAILWEKVKPTLTPGQIEQFKQADLNMISCRDLFKMIAGIVGEDEAKHQMDMVAMQLNGHEKLPNDIVENVPTCPAADPKVYSV